MTSVASNYLTLIEIMLIVLCLMSIARTAAPVSSGFYNAALMRGASKWTYWGSMYVNDVLINMIPAPILYASILAFKINAPGLPYCWMLWAITEPVF